MARFHRRRFLGVAGACCSLGVAAPATPALGSQPSRARPRPPLIQIGQIGTGHAHAAGKMSTLRRLAGHFQVVGVVEPDPERRRAGTTNN